MAFSGTLQAPAKASHPDLFQVAASFTFGPTEGNTKAVIGEPFSLSSLDRASAGILELTIPGSGDIKLVCGIVQLEDSGGEYPLHASIISYAARVLTIQVVAQEADGDDLVFNVPTDPSEDMKLHVLLTFQGGAAA
jgi:hypothetical protein